MNPDISLATKSGHFYLLTTFPCGRSFARNSQGKDHQAQSVRLGLLRIKASAASGATTWVLSMWLGKRSSVRRANSSAMDQFNALSLFAFSRAIVKPEVILEAIQRNGARMANATTRARRGRR